MIDREYIERKCDQLVAAGFWPREQHLPFRAWLNNFAPREEDANAAATILDRFVFVNPEHASLAVLDGYVRYVGHLCDDRSPALGPRAINALNDVHESVHFAAVQGESPNPAESGRTYMRIARETLKVSEERIHDLPDAIRKCADGSPLVLLDDFAGTGNHILNTLVATPTGTGQSLKSLLDEDGVTVCCITAVMTSYAVSRLREQVPKLRLFPGYFVSEADYSVDALLPRSEFPEVHALLDKMAPRLSAGRIDPVKGMNAMGLMIGVHDRIPDTSLPLLWAEGEGNWTPLKAREQRWR